MQSSLTLVNPQNGNLAFKLLPFEGNNHFDHIQRLNYYAMIWVQAGQGTVKTGFSSYQMEDDMLFSFAPYEPFMFLPDAHIKGVALYFHPDFFCIHKHQQEVACNGILFNNLYETPSIKIDAVSKGTFEMLCEQMKAEIENKQLAQYELLVSYLKIFLITASRLKTQQQPAGKETNTESKEPFILQTLKNYIETHFKTKHSASDYADMLHITPKALAKITKTHFNKTLTDLIAARIVIEAKRELYLTSKPVKQIAYELGYEDAYYFSRFFKNNTDVSPQLYRETVGFARAEVQ